MNALALKGVDVLREDEHFGAVLGDGVGRNHKDVLQFLDADEQTNLLPGPITPQKLRTTIAFDGANLVLQRQLESKRSRNRIDRIGDVADVKSLCRGRPTG